MRFMSAKRLGKLMFSQKLVAIAALFLATKSEETPCLLNTMLRASCEVCQKHNFAFFLYLVYSHDWFDQYRERVIEAEKMMLTTLDFELDVRYPYIPLTSVLSKLGFSQTALLNLAWNVVSEGLDIQALHGYVSSILHKCYQHSCWPQWSRSWANSSYFSCYFDTKCDANWCIFRS